MEGTAYEIAVNRQVLKELGVEPKMLVATGGGAKSDLWLQIKADVLNVPVAALDAEEAVCKMEDKTFFHDIAVSAENAMKENVKAAISVFAGLK